MEPAEVLSKSIWCHCKREDDTIGFHVDCPEVQTGNYFLYATAASTELPAPLDTSPDPREDGGVHIVARSSRIAASC